MQIISQLKLNALLKPCLDLVSSQGSVQNKKMYYKIALSNVTSKNKLYKSEQASEKISSRRNSYLM